MKFTSVALLAISSSIVSAVPLERRAFGKEQAVQLGTKIAAVSTGCAGNGDASLGFNGQEIKTLLAAADPCDKLKLADEVVTKAKTCPADAQAKIIAVAMELVAAEKNFNPFNGNKDSICNDAALPASVELQGILQKVDDRTTAPNNNDAALAASAAALNAKVASTLKAAQAAGKGPGNGGKSLAQLTADNGFAEIQNFNGAAAAVGNNNAVNNNNAANNAVNNAVGAVNNVANNFVNNIANVAIPVGFTPANAANAVAPVAAAPAAAEPVVAAPAAAPAAVAASNLGVCDANAAQLTVALAADPARADEVRFVPGGFQKDKVFGGQGSALNGGIIANFICDRLASDCKADAGVVSSCRAAQKNVEGKKGGKGLGAAQLQTLGQVADDFNKAIGIQTNFVASVVQGAAVNNNAAVNNDAANNNAAVNNNNAAANNGAASNCGAKKLEVVVVGKEQRFGLDGQQVALNPVIPIERICNSLKDAACKAACDTAKAAAAATGIKGNSQGQGDLAALNKLADDFNKALP